MGKETQPQVGAGAGWVIQPSPPDALTPGLLHPVGGTALVFTGVHIQRLGGWLTLGIGDGLPLQDSAEDDMAHLALITGP